MCVQECKKPQKHISLIHTHSHPLKLDIIIIIIIIVMIIILWPTFSFPSLQIYIHEIILDITRMTLYTHLHHNSISSSSRFQVDYYLLLLFLVFMSSSTSISFFFPLSFSLCNIKSEKWKYQMFGCLLLFSAFILYPFPFPRFSGLSISYSITHTI